MGGEDSFSPVGILKTLTTAAGWILTVVGVAGLLALPEFAEQV